VLSKNNEIVACKASGISLYRLAMPLLLGGLTLAATMIIVDDLYLPYTNQRQTRCAIRSKANLRRLTRVRNAGFFGETEKSIITTYSIPLGIFFAGLTVLELESGTFSHQSDGCSRTRRSGVTRRMFGF